MKRNVLIGMLDNVNNIKLVKMDNEKSALALHEVLTSQVLQRSHFEGMASTISTDITSSGHLQYIPNIMDSCYTSKQVSILILYRTVYNMSNCFTITTNIISLSA